MWPFNLFRKDPAPEREISDHDIELSKKLKEIHKKKKRMDKERLLGTMKETQAILEDAEKLPSAIDADCRGSDRSIRAEKKKVNNTGVC